jgi:hypothetical protein
MLPSRSPWGRRFPTLRSREGYAAPQEEGTRCASMLANWHSNCARTHLRAVSAWLPLQPTQHDWLVSAATSYVRAIPKLSPSERRPRDSERPRVLPHHAAAGSSGSISMLACHHASSAAAPTAAGAAGSPGVPLCWLQAARPPQLTDSDPPECRRDGMPSCRRYNCPDREQPAKPSLRDGMSSCWIHAVRPRLPPSRDPRR